MILKWYPEVTLSIVRFDVGCSDLRLHLAVGTEHGGSIQPQLREVRMEERCGSEWQQALNLPI